MACLNKSNADNFLTWNKLSGSLTLSELQSGGLPLPCDNTVTEVPTNFIFTTATFNTLDATCVSSESLFQWEIATDIAFSSIVQTITNSSTSVQFTGLDSSTEYFGRVKSIGAINSPYSNIDNSLTSSKNPLEMFGSNLIMWYRSDDFIANVGDTQRTSQLNDKSGNSRHLVSTIAVNQPYNENGTDDGGRAELDGHIAQHVSKAETISSIKKLAIDPTSWGAPVSPDIIMITVVSGASAGNDQRHHFSRNDVADGDSFGKSPYSLFSGSSGNLWKYTGIDDGPGTAADYVTILDDLHDTPLVKQSIMSEIKADISKMDTYLNGVFQSNTTDYTTAPSLKPLNSFIMFDAPTSGVTGSPNMCNWETFLIEGSYVTLASELNEIHEFYLNDRYPSLNIVSPNL